MGGEIDHVQDWFGIDNHNIDLHRMVEAEVLGTNGKFEPARRFRMRRTDLSFSRDCLNCSTRAHG